MSYWKIGNRDDDLSFYVSAETKEMAVRVVEELVGPINPAHLVAKKVPEGELPEDVEVLE